MLGLLGVARLNASLGTSGSAALGSTVNPKLPFPPIVSFTTSSVPQVAKSRKVKSFREAVSEGEERVSNMVADKVIAHLEGLA